MKIITPYERLKLRTDATIAQLRADNFTYRLIIAALVITLGAIGIDTLVH